MSNIFITGCSSGFGLLTALEFARKGDRVFATMRNTAKGAELERTRDAEKLPIDILQLDLLDPPSITAAVGKAIDAAGPIDVLVNNAAMELRSSIEDAAEDEVRKQFETNVFGTYRVIHAVLPAMRERGSGVIVNLSSAAGFIGIPYAGYYSATKHAVEAISEALYWEMHPFGVRVIVIQPGAFATSFGSNAFDARAFDASSPHVAVAERFAKARTRLYDPDAPPADPADVARAIYDAVHDPEPKLRYPVGADAQLLATVRRGNDFEGYEAVVRQTLDWKE